MNFIHILELLLTWTALVLRCVPGGGVGNGPCVVGLARHCDVVLVDVVVKLHPVLADVGDNLVDQIQLMV